MDQANPKNFDPKMKNNCINQNIYHTGYGNYKTCPSANPVKFRYLNTYDPGPITNICKVYVFNKHPIDVIDNISPHGITTLQSNKSYPIMIYPVGKDFLGTNFESREGIVDEIIILRTNYAYIIKKQNDLFPIKNDKDVIYTKLVTSIRDINYNFMQYDNLFRMGIVTVCPSHEIELLEGNLLSSKDLLKFQMLIESVFQVAICGFHDVLVLTLFGKEFGIPIDDQILIYNHCIMKYGHKFKDIVIAIPPYEGKELAEYFDKNIIKPHDLTKEIDMKYETEILSKRMMKLSSKNDMEQNSSNTIMKTKSSI